MRFLNVKKTAFYAHWKKKGAKRAKKELIISIVKEIRKKHPKCGTVKLKAMLARSGIYVGRDWLNDCLAEYGMLQPVRGGRKFTTSTPGVYDKEYVNHVKDLVVTHVNQVLCTDITYVHTTEGVLYLYVIIDMYSRKILSYYVSNDLRSESALKCLKDALKDIDNTEGIIHHSDRGCQYTSQSYLSHLDKKKMQSSFTGRDHCYDNATMERVFNTLKHEYGLSGVIASKKAALDLTKNAVYLYNYERLHQALDFNTPSEVYDNQMANQSIILSAK